MKNIFSAQGRVVSSPSKQIFDCSAPSGPVYLDCHSPNIFYIITCSGCSPQYAKETGSNWHKACFKDTRKYSFCRILFNHFHKGISKNAPYTVQVLEKFDGYWRTARGAMHQ